MAVALTGRSILKSLHEYGGTTTFTRLTSLLNADPAAVERLLQSLLVAKLVYRTSDELSLSATGRSWCAAEFKPDGPRAEAAALTPAFSADKPGKANQLPAISTSKSRPTPAPRKSDRMLGVQVVRVARRIEQHACAAPVSVVGKSSPIEPREPEPTPPLVAVGEIAAPTTPSEDQRRTKSAPKRIVVDKSGFVTHINGRKIY